MFDGKEIANRDLLDVELYPGFHQNFLFIFSQPWLEVLTIIQIYQGGSSFFW